MSTMIEVPVVLNFDMSKPIGRLIVDRAALPGRPDYVFALNYMIERGTGPGAGHQLVAVSLMRDEAYSRYLASPDAQKLRKLTEE